MDITNALKRTGRNDITLRAIVAKTVKDIYHSEIEILSVTLKSDSLFIKTWKSIVNSELNMMSEKIKTQCIKKLTTLGISLKKDIRFRFI